MTAAEKIAEARALIEPLTGHDDGPWVSAHRGTRTDFQKGRDYHRVTTLKEATDADAVAIVHVQWRQRRAANADLIAAAPALRDTVPVLADGWEAEKARADALAQENAKQARRIEALEEALRFYANPVIYQPHPHGPAFDRRDVSYVAVAALSPTPSPETAQ